MYPLLISVLINASQVSLPASLSFHSKVTNQVSTRLRDTPTNINDVPVSDIPQAPIKKERISAKWLPVGGLKAPLLLDGTMPGDVGFDPLGFVKSEKTLFWMRDAEVKHARLAMLGAAGW